MNENMNTPTSSTDENNKEEVNESYKAIKQEIYTIQNPKKSIQSNLINLAISIFLFISLGFISSSISDILILVGILFFHELGHLLGMKLFKYKNLKMMFIPLLGAAVFRS